MSTSFKFDDKLIFIMFTSILLCVGFLFGPHLSDAAGGWSYHGDTGPENWAGLDGGEDCSGSSQSPINFDTDNMVEKLDFEDWNLEGFDAMTDNETAQIVNNGHTVQVNVDGVYKTSGGGLPANFTALQFHFHWGEDNNEGSEHTRNGKPYPLEMHIVHWDSDRFFIPIPAIKAEQGLAVLGVWAEVGDENPAFNAIINALENVEYHNNTAIGIEESFKVIDLLPKDLSKFYRYSGSLTTPGCYESVVWTVFADTVELSVEQLAKFRTLSGNYPPPNPIPENYTMPKEHPIDINFRPVQTIGDRTVYASYQLPKTMATDPMDVESTTMGTSFIHPNIFHVFLLLVVYIGFVCR